KGASNSEELETPERIPRSELERLVQQRREDLSEEREKLRREFEASVEKLYGKAVQLYRDNQFDRSLKVFQEIDYMLPDYKQVRQYIAELQNKPKNLPPPPPAVIEETIVSPAPTPSREGLYRRDLITEALDAIERGH
ncbi:MAG: hypothetical protein KC618_08345, partial [Candidatus Omnitrophica bacterium]|nr:hypothetical protein [Candidatus Omnitrophota bacterium]